MIESQKVKEKDSRSGRGQARKPGAGANGQHTNGQDNGGKFVPLSITLPPKLAEFAEARANEPLFAGNMSAYVRYLVLGDESKTVGSKS